MNFKFSKETGAAYITRGGKKIFGAPLHAIAKAKGVKVPKAQKVNPTKAASKTKSHGAARSHTPKKRNASATTATATKKASSSSTGAKKKTQPKRRNVEGFKDARGVFHPIRSGADYSAKAVGENDYQPHLSNRLHQVSKAYKKRAARNPNDVEIVTVPSEFFDGLQLVGEVEVPIDFPDDIVIESGEQFAAHHHEHHHGHHQHLGFEQNPKKRGRVVF